MTIVSPLLPTANTFKMHGQKIRFQRYKSSRNSAEILMLCEKKIVIENETYREIRRFNSNGHQTAIITNHPSKLLSTLQIAEAMFSRWNQENYFKYLITEFNLDKHWEYGFEAVNENLLVTNPQRKPLVKEIAKLAKALSRKTRFRLAISLPLSAIAVANTSRFLVLIIQNK